MILGFFFVLVIGVNAGVDCAVCAIQCPDCNNETGVATPLPFPDVELPVLDVENTANLCALYSYFGYLPFNCSDQVLMTETCCRITNGSCDSFDAEPGIDRDDTGGNEYTNFTEFASSISCCCTPNPVQPPLPRQFLLLHISHLRINAAGARGPLSGKFATPLPQNLVSFSLSFFQQASLAQLDLPSTTKSVFLRQNRFDPGTISQTINNLTLQNLYLTNNGFNADITLYGTSF